jgi:hypothetical protein
MMLRTLEELGTEGLQPEMTIEEIESASVKVAGIKQTTGFKRDEHGLYIESRQIKAAIKEACNILYEWQGSAAKQREAFGVSKSARSFLAERVFVEPDHISLGREEPDGVEMFVGQVSGPQGRRSTLGYHEYVMQAQITFDVKVTRDAIPQEWWPELWTQMEENAVGALRSQGFGKFDLVAWDRVGAQSTNGHATPRVARPAKV